MYRNQNDLINKKYFASSAVDALEKSNSNSNRILEKQQIQLHFEECTIAAAVFILLLPARLITSRSWGHIE